MPNGPGQGGGGGAPPMGPEEVKSWTEGAVKATEESSKKLKAAFKAFNVELAKSTTDLKEQDFTFKQILASLKEATSQEEKLNAQLKEGSAPMFEQLSIQEQMVEARRNEINAMLALLEAQGSQGEHMDKHIEALREEEQALRLNLRYFNQQDTAVAGIAQKTIGVAYAWENSVFKALQKTGKLGVERLGIQIAALFNPMEVVYNFMLKTFTATVEFNKELIETKVSLNKLTAMSGRFAKDLEDAAYSIYRAGGTLEDAAQITGTLIEGFVDFTITNKTMREELEIMAVKLKSVGVGSEDFATSLNILTQNMGYSVPMAKALTEELTTYAESIGMAPSKFMKEFATSIPKLEVYGSRAIDVFRKLELRSKASGIGVEQLISSTDKMDTFEGAAEAAGHLNAALGGAYFDSLELLMANEEERLDIIKNTINSTGIQFNQLGKFEKRLLATAAGFETAAEMQRFLNSETGKFIGMQENFNDLADRSVSIFDSFKTMMKAFAITLTPAIDMLDSMLKWMTATEERAEAFGILFFMVLPAALALFSATAITALATLGSIAAVVGSLILLGGQLADVWPKIMDGNFADITGKMWGKIIGAMVGAIAGFFLPIPGGTMVGLALGAALGAKMGGSIGGAIAGHADGVTNFKGGPSVVGERGPELVTFGSGANVLTNENLGRTLAALTDAVNRLGGDGKPVQVNLVVDGKKLASAVHNNTEYITI